MCTHVVISILDYCWESVFNKVKEGERLPFERKDDWVSNCSLKRNGVRRMIGLQLFKWKSCDLLAAGFFPLQKKCCRGTWFCQPSYHKDKPATLFRSKVFGTQKGRQARWVQQLGSCVPRADRGSGGLEEAGGARSSLHPYLHLGARGGKGQLLPTLQWHLAPPGELPARPRRSCLLVPVKPKRSGRAKASTFSTGNRKALRAFLLESTRSTECSPFSFSLRFFSAVPLEEVLSIYG